MCPGNSYSWGDNAGQHVFIPQIILIPSDVQILFPLQQCQFPVCVAFDMTINKAQAQSVKYIGFDLHTPVFTHGQFYVAVSHATSVHRIKAIWDPKCTDPITGNVVYSEVLLD